MCDMLPDLAYSVARVPRMHYNVDGGRYWSMISRELVKWSPSDHHVLGATTECRMTKGRP